MKFKLKKYIYLVNDLTNILLKKDRERLELSAMRFRNAFLVLAVILTLSVLINILFILRLI